MTREEAKEWLPIIQAWAEGKPIQYQINPGSWVTDINKDLYTSNPPSNYRVKPEPNYRPFKSQEECWQEMHKHPDFGWVKNKQNNSYCKISRIARYHTEERILCVGCSYTLAKAFDSFIFTDGTPFGIQED